jgi:hypothetical protein
MLRIISRIHHREECGMKNWTARVSWSRAAGVWVLTAFLAIALCTSAYGQSATAGAGEVACAFNNTCGSGKPAPATPRAPANPAAAKAAQQWNAIQNNLKNEQQIINNAGDAILDVLRSNNSDANSDAESDDSGDDNSADGSVVNNERPAIDYAALAAANAAAAAARRREQINADAAQILQASQSDMDSANGNGGEAVTPNAASAVNALLDSGQPSTSSNSAINSLLGDSTRPPATATTTASAVANLLNINDASASASAFPAYASLQTPTDPQFNAATQDSEDQPNPNAGASLSQLLQSTGQEAKDALSGLVVSGRTLASSYANSQVVQWLASQGWNGTTAPLPTATDTQDTATNLTFGQASVGLGDILQGMATGPSGVAKGIYNYGAKMVNQMGAYLGLATTTILEQEPDGQQ